MKKQEDAVEALLEQFKNTIGEGIIVLTATNDHRVFHYNGSVTSQRKTESARAVEGNCKKM